jgi:hypothetical protein
LSPFFRSIIRRKFNDLNAVAERYRRSEAAAAIGVSSLDRTLCICI